MPRIFKTRTFARWASKAGLTDKVLSKAAEEIRHGLVDADLGGGVVKKRVALPGHGKRGSVRILVATRKGEHCFFLEGFKKNEKDNISDKELKELKGFAQDLLETPPDKIALLLAAGALQELRHETKS